MARHLYWSIVLLALTSPAARAQITTVSYSLRGLGDDPDLGKWLLKTLPQVIEPGTWSPSDLHYYAPGRVLVVRHRSDVQAEVRRFLDGLKAAAPERSCPPHPMVVQAGYAPAPASVPAVSGTTPVPKAAGPRQQPPHRFHFSILYEGDGLIDSNVVEFAKAMAAAAVASNSEVSGLSLPSPRYLEHPPTRSRCRAARQIPFGFDRA
jgi:hypothetical protein